MSEAKTDVPEVSLLDQFKAQHASFVQQKDLTQNNLNQLIGAVYACEIMIKKLEEESSKQQPVGDKGNVETDEQTEEQAA